jgi:DNA-binding transcriptional ArsR family regulator
MRALMHPDRGEIVLPAVLDALSDPTRLAIAAFLAETEIEAQCGRFLCFGSKTNLTYHLARMREAGVTRTRIEGTKRLISLRKEDLEARFPGLLQTILAAARAEPELAAILERARAEAAA